jgi:hypothetical protein
VAQTITRGSTITLDAFYRDGTGALVTPVDPFVSIVDPDGDTVVNLATPTEVTTGHYQYEYPVASDASLGAWAARWFGTVDGTPLEDEDGFTVLRAGTFDVGGGTSSVCSPWATTADLCTPCDGYEDFDDGLLLDSLDMASDVLFNLTGRRWPGECTEVVRPQGRWRQGAPRSFWPGDTSWSWGWCSCERGRETGCTRVPEVRLPGSPVDVNSIFVTLDGVSFADWRLDDDNWLVRTDGDGWPCCQRLDLDTTEDDTWEIAYTRGTAPPIGGIRAAASLACEFVLACTPADEGGAACRLPKRITSITRQGVTIAVLDPLTLFGDGLTGIPEVDIWIGSVMKGDSRRRANVMIPGRPRPVRRTNT